MNNVIHQIAKEERRYPHYSGNRCRKSAWQNTVSFRIKALNKLGKSKPLTNTDPTMLKNFSKSSSPKYKNVFISWPCEVYPRTTHFGIWKSSTEIHHLKIL